MPYIPLKNGQSVFIQDPNEAQQRYQQEWGGGQPQKPQGASPKPAAKPKAQAKPKQPQRGFDLGRFLQQAGGKAVETLKGSAKAGVTQFLAGPLAPFVQLGQQAQNINKTKIPGTKTTVGGEIRRVATEAGRQLVNAPIAAAEQLGALTQGVDLGGALAGGGVPSPETNPQLLEQKQNNAVAALEALQKSGKTAEGFSYGIKPSVPLLGPVFSDDSEFVKRYVKPATAIGQLAASTAAAMLFDKGVSSLVKGPSAISTTGKGLQEIWKAKDIKAGLETTARFLINDILPNAVQDAMFFMPQPPAKMQKEFERVQQLQTPEERIAAARVVRATSKEEFNYAFEQLKNAAIGTGALTGLRGAFWAANRFMSKATSGIPAQQAMEEALNDAVPLAKQELEAEGFQKAYELREERLGTVTAELYRKIDENVGKISQAARSGAEAFLTKQQEATLETENLIQKIDEGFAATPADATELDNAISKLRSDLAVTTPDQIQGKRANLQARLAEYERVMTEDPDWINRSTGTGKRASKNATKVRRVVDAIQKLDELDSLVARRTEVEQAQLGQIERFAELGRVTESAFDASIGFKNALTDARILVDALDELDTERVALLTARNNQLFAENRLDEINSDFSLNDAFGEAYGELKDILNAAEAAVASENLNPEFMQTFVQRVEAIQNKVIENGGLAPTIPEMPEGVQMPPAEAAVAIPKQEAPIQNQVPVTVDEAGEIKIDTDELAVRRVANETPGDEPAVTIRETVQEINRDRGEFQDPTATKEDLDNFLNGFDQTIAKQQELIKSDLENGTDLAEDATEIYTTNAVKYTSDLENAAAVKAAVDLLETRKPLLPTQYGIALRKLASMLGGNTTLTKLAVLAEGEKLGKDVAKNLNKIMVVTSLLDDSALNALKSARDLRQILKGQEVEDLDRVSALVRFQDNYKVLMANVKAINAQFEGFGNALRLFDRRNRLGFSTTDPKQLFSEVNRQLAGFGDSAQFAEDMSVAAREAQAELDNTIGNFFKKVESGEDLTDEEMEGMERLVEKLYETQGDLTKIKELEITGDAVLARLQIGSPLSNPATIFSIPLQGIPEGAGQITGQAIGNILTGTKAKFLGQTQLATESFQQAKLEMDTLLVLRHAIGDALNATYNRFVFGRAITDPVQAADAAYELQRSAGLRREEAIAQDLAATKIKTPFFNYIIERGEENPELFDTLNKSRVMLKVFHDYFMPGEAWNKRSLLGKGLGLTTTSLRGMGLGKTSYYPGGENVNLTIFGQLSATADELVTALFANARVRALAIRDVDEKIAAGTLDIADRADEIAKYLDKEFNSLYKPVKVGFDQTTIGYSVLDNQILGLTRAVNLTEELTGPLQDIEGAINKLRQSNNPVTAAFGRDLFPFLVSPINGVKRAVMIASGGEIARFGVDVGRIGAKALPEKVLDILPPNFKQNITDFESKYFSDDIGVRSKAQGALAMAIGLQALAFFHVRDGNQDITGGLENTYRETAGAVDAYTMKIGDRRWQYRYLPFYGNTLAFQATLRDLYEFAPGRDTSGLMALGVASLANYILETPAIAGMDRLIKALTSAGTGDISRLQKILADSVAKAGDPYLNLRKVVTQGFDPRKPASPITRFVQRGWYERGSVSEKGMTIQDVVNSAFDTGFGTFGIAAEYSPLGFLIDATVSVIKNEPEARSRKALWYGKPGETINANHAGKWYPLQAVLGRYWTFPDKLEGDPVAKEMVYNLIAPPRTSLYNSDGVGINETILNDFNHFLNSEFEYRDPVTNKTHKGIYSAIKDLIKSPIYTQHPSIDSPFKMTVGPFGVPIAQADWDRDNNMRRTILSNYVRTLVDIAKEEFLMGTNPGQRYKMPEDMKQFILNQRQTGGVQ